MLNYKLIFPYFSNIFEEPSFPQDKINPVQSNEETPETTSNQIDAGKRAGLRSKVSTQKFNKRNRRTYCGYVIGKRSFFFVLFILKYFLNFKLFTTIKIKRNVLLVHIKFVIQNEAKNEVKQLPMRTTMTGARRRPFS